MKRFAPLLLLMVILCLGAGFRLHQLDEKSLWSDEIATIASGLGHSIDPDAYRLKGKRWDPPKPIPAGAYLRKATKPHPGDLRDLAGWLRHWKRTARVLKDNVHPPLFFGLMGLWMEATGIAPATLRLPAAWFGILSIPLMYLLAWRLSDAALWAALRRKDTPQEEHRQPPAGMPRQAFALLSAALFAFSAYQVDHAQDARPYTLLVLLSLIAVLTALEVIRRRGSGWLPWLLLSLTLAAGLYTQYFFALFAGWLLLMLALLPNAGILFRAPVSPVSPQDAFPRTFRLKLALCLLLIGLLWLPWLESFQAQMTFLKHAGHYTLGLWRPLQLPEKIWRIVCEFFLPDSPAGKILPMLIFTVAALPQARFPRPWRPLRLNQWRPSPVCVIVLLWLIGIIGGQIALDLLRGAHTATIRRYLLLASPACYLLMAWALVRTAGRPGGFIPAIVMTATLLGLMLTDTAHRLGVVHVASDEFKRAAAWINNHRQPGDQVWISRSGPMAVGMAYYLQPDIPMLGVERKASPLPVPEGKRIWLVFSHAAPSTRRDLETRLSEKKYQPVSAQKFPGVRVTLHEKE